MISNDLPTQYWDVLSQKDIQHDILKPPHQTTVSFSLIRRTKVQYTKKGINAESSSNKSTIDTKHCSSGRPQGGI